MNYSPDPLIAALAQRRRTLRIRVSYLATALHYDRKTIHSWERGASTPTITAVRAYADLLGAEMHVSLPELPPPAPPVRRGRVLRPHGTFAALNRHRYSGEPTCAACRAFAAEYRRNRRAAAKQAAA